MLRMVPLPVPGRNLVVSTPVGIVRTRRLVIRRVLRARSSDTATSRSIRRSAGTTAGSQRHAPSAAWIVASVGRRVRA